jgi:hypothetical protein
MVLWVYLSVSTIIMLLNTSDRGITYVGVFTSLLSLSLSSDMMHLLANMLLLLSEPL